MADNNEKAKEDKKAVDAKKSDTSVMSKQVSSRNVLIGVLGLLVLLFVFFAGAAATRFRMNRHSVIFDNSFGPRPALREQGLRTYGAHGGGMNIHIQDSDNRTTGVVTAVNGDAFTVAGHGSTTEVKTDSSTQYQGGNEVKQNDTVIVLGSTSDNTLKADTIIINP